MEILNKDIIHLDQAVITPTVFNKRKQQLQGCVYDKNGSVITSSQRILRQGSIKPVDPECIDVADCEEEIQGTVLYLGHYTGQYGHFLLESLARCWIFEQAPSYDWILFSPFVHRTPPFAEFSPARISFESLSIDLARVKLVHSKTRVEKLLLPTKIIELTSPQTANPDAEWIYNTIAKHCRNVFRAEEKTLPRKVYLSRSHWRFSGLATNPLTRAGIKLTGQVLGIAGLSLKSLLNRPVINEQEVEEVFRSFGFEVLHPGEMSFEEQVSIYSQAEVLAGFSGSAMHNTIFMPENSRAVHLENVQEVRAPQRLCDGLSRVRTDVIEFAGKVVDPAIGAVRVDIWNLHNHLKRILGS